MNGYLDNVPVGQVPRFHDELLEHLRTEGAVLSTIRETGEISDETEEKLKKELEHFVSASTSRKSGGSPASHGVGPGPQAADQVGPQHAQDHARDGARRCGEAAARGAADQRACVRTRRRWTS